MAKKKTFGSGVGSVDNHADLISTGPGTLAGHYMRRFWQPVFRSKDLPKGRAMPLEIMSERFTLYRGESGAPYLLGFRCAHRGSQLSTGWVAGENIRCRYHGWMYDKTGQCVEQPNEVETFAAKVRIPKYPIQEYLGLIWAYFGEDEPPPMRRFPDHERPGVVEVGPPERWPCNYFNRIDNDPMHLSFTHSESLRRVGRTVKAEDPKAWETEYGVCKNAEGRVHFYLPNVTRSHSKTRVMGTHDDARTYSVDRLLIYIPVNDENSVTFAVDYLPLTGDTAEAYRRSRAAVDLDTANLQEMAEKILAGRMRIEDMDQSLSMYHTFWIEDYVTLVGQGRFADRTNEHLGRIDQAVILIRKLWRREMNALAEGLPLKQWTSPAGVMRD
jgi:5,5'-dehydrodivanillate O-demethylase oxygenase subunit